MSCNILNSGMLINKPTIQPMDMTKSKTLLHKCHQDFSHMPLPKLQLIAKQNEIPPHLANFNMPTCSTCLYSMMGKRNW